MEYYPRQDIKVLMMLGINAEGTAKPSPEPNNGCEADMISLLIFDEAAQSSPLLLLNRDTMLDMLVLDDHGRAVGSSFGQLAFSHTYGYGMEDSCENTRKAVSDFLGGITINYYVALNLDAITILNDAVGGVTVNVTDDFSQVYSTLQMGELTLKGSQASSYIRSHSGTDGQLNRTAVSRQEQYMYGFVTALKEKSKQDISSMARLYDEIRDYAVTDCTVSDLNRLMNDYSDYSVEAVLTLEGDRIPGGEYHEFHVDEKALDDLILRLFYAEKQDCQIIE